MEVSLENLLTALDFQPKGVKTYFNLRNGNIITECDPHFRNLEKSDLILLPMKNEEDIMWYYCDTLPYADIREELMGLIQEEEDEGGNFQKGLFYHALEDDWYRFRESVLRDLALDWCSKNKLVHS